MGVRWNRRQFLLVGALAAGCSRSRDGAIPLTPAEQADFAQARALRDEHLALLAQHRVPADARFTTPAPAVDLLATFPELKGLVKVAVRLHPRFSDPFGPEVSSLGGPMLWPAEDPWPEDPVTRTPMVPLLQLRADDAPPQCTYPPGKDLLQVFLAPRTVKEGQPIVSVRWRRQGEVQGSLASMPDLSQADPGRVPVPCRIFPERVMEFPDWQTLMRTSMKDRLTVWQPPEQMPPLRGEEYYTRYLACARGTKVGGYPGRVGNPPGCLTCRWGMEYLLTVDPVEWDDSDLSRWRPVEDANSREASRRAMGLTLPGPLRVYVCRRCADWPVHGTL